MGKEKEKEEGGGEGEGEEEKGNLVIKNKMEIKMY